MNPIANKDGRNQLGPKKLKVPVRSMYIGVKTYGLGWQVLVISHKLTNFRYVVRDQLLAALIQDRCAI